MRYQHEAHSASLKLQRQSFEAAYTLEQSHLLERENVVLKEELATLRAHPDVTPHPASFQVSELTLALRKLSDKLTLVEGTLFSRTNELVSTQHSLSQAKLEAQQAWELITQIRGKEEESRSRERELELKAKAAEEERRMADLVVQEYADLVRSLEGRPNTSSRPTFPSHNEANDSTPSLIEGLEEGKLGLQRLLGEFYNESERLSKDISQLHSEIETLTFQLASERASTEEDQTKLAQVLVQLDQQSNDDNTAAKMVSRYM